MFKPAGLLRKIACPIHAEGLCDRPHCHLAHVSNSKGRSSHITKAPNTNEEYDPAANYETFLAKRTSKGNDSDISFVDCSPSQTATISFGLQLPLVSRSKHSCQSVKATTRSADKRNWEAPSGLQIATELLEVHAKSNEASRTATTKRSKAISALQILDRVDSGLPEQLSPVSDGESGKKTSPPKRNKADLLSSKKAIDNSSVAKKISYSSPLVEAAELRCKRKLQTPAEACTARLRECEQMGNVPATSKGSQVQTAAMAARVAHAPRYTTQAKQKKRPKIPIEFNAKVSTFLRQQCLDKIYDELLKYRDHGFAYDEAVRLETEGHGRCSNDKLYRQVMANIMIRVRKEHSSSTSSPSKKGVSHDAMLMPAGANSVGVGASGLFKSTATTVNLTKSQLHKLLRKYVLSPEQLKNNGYPVEDASGVISIKPPDKRVTQRQYILPTSAIAAGERECSRCGKRFQISPETGTLVKKEECQYHSGRVIKIRTHARHLEQVYNCCQASATNSNGCKVASSHVHEHNRSTDVEGFIRTPENNNPSGVFGLDCEMIYTLKGNELARVTVVDHMLSVVLDALVKPETEILDCNTEFSGLNSCDFDNVTENLASVQRKLCSLVNSASILVGHSLESDLIALKLIHANVVDTAVVFPHPLGAPYKRALRTLVHDILSKAIQQDIGGHDSVEDAASALELMIHKAKSDYVKSAGLSTVAVADRSGQRRPSLK